MVPTVLLALFSALGLAGGIAGNIFVNRQRFYRRNQFGVEGFRSYGEAATTRSSEGCLKILSWLFILGGILGLLAACAVGVLYTASR